MVSKANPYGFGLDEGTQFPEDGFRQPRLGHLEEGAFLAPDVLRE
jgi:hypothetical protein